MEHSSLFHQKLIKTGMLKIDRILRLAKISFCKRNDELENEWCEFLSSKKPWLKQGFWQKT
jgi:hypothetical protein